MALAPLFTDEGERVFIFNKFFYIVVVINQNIKYCLRFKITRSYPNNLWWESK